MKAYKKVELYQRTQEWLDYRALHIGASDAPVIMGISPWKTAKELYHEKMRMITKNISNPAIERGIENEDHALVLFEFAMGDLYQPCCIESLDYPWMSASLDGLNLSEDCFVEIKCPGRKDHDLALREEVPPKYIPQLQHQLGVSGFEYGYYCSYYNDNIVHFKVERDEDYIKKMIEKELEFLGWMLNYNPPLDFNGAGD